MRILWFIALVAVVSGCAPKSSTSTEHAPSITNETVVLDEAKVLAIARQAISTNDSEPARILQDVQRVVPAVSAPASESETLALLPAHFSDSNSKVGGPVGRGLSGEDLYLFPDRSYLYLRWADILPPTIFDRGTWLFGNNVMSLQSDHSVPQRDFPKDSRFVPLYYTISGKRTLLLMGASWNFSYFEKKAKTNDDFMLFLCTLTHIEPIEPVNAETLQKKIYADSWKPIFFSK